MGRYAILLSLILLTGCGVKGFHVVRTGDEPIRVETLIDGKRVECPRAYFTLNEVQATEFYSVCNVYLIYPTQKVR